MIRLLALLIFHSYCCQAGVPLPFAEEATSRKIQDDVGEGDTSKDFAARLQILQHFAQIMQSLGKTNDPSARDSSILVAYGEFERLRIKDGQRWSVRSKLQFLGAKLFLYGGSIQGQISEPQSHILSSTLGRELVEKKKLILYEIFRTAVSYIQAFDQAEEDDLSLPVFEEKSLDGQSAPPNNEIPIQLYFPKYYFTTLFYAALTLYHFLANVSQMSTQDQESARNHIKKAQDLLSHCASHDVLGEWSRLAKNIEVVGQFDNIDQRVMHLGWDGLHVWQHWSDEQRLNGMG